MTKTFKSFADLKVINNPNPDKWAEFLKVKGHTPETFGYLPEPLKLALKMSFAKKSN